tara:strand:- start:559 stop:1464 length:906 start_codon:yes stop_codon:yes gene_type:complete
MAFTTTSNFAGKAAGFYISAALKASNSLDYLTMIENVKFKSNIQQMAGSGVVADATCNFNGAGTLALTEKVLEPKNLQINLDLCKSTLLDSWEALQMRAGAGAPPPASFDDYVISYMGDIIAEATENSIWTGTDVAGKFNGFLGAVTGLLLPGVDGTVVQDAAGGAYTAGTIIAELQGAVASIPTSTLGKEDLHIYMSQRTYQYYISAVSTLGYVNAYNMNGDYVPMFEGYKIAVCNGMAENELVIAQKSNLFFGTDLISDATRITLMDMAALDGSDNMRLVARYSAGVQTGVGADIVRQA